MSIHTLRRLRLLFGCVGLLATSALHATMELNNVILHFEPGEPARQDVEISNSGDTPLYVEIEPRLVLSPGTAQEDRSPISDPRRAGLLVTPNKLIVPPGSAKSVRMVKMGETMDERVFRVAAKPVVGGVEAEQSGLKILVGYEVLAIVYPTVPKPKLQVERHGRRLTVKNVGNTNVLLREGFQCETEDMPREQCEALPGKRVYPGNVWELDLPLDRPVTYYQSIGSRNFVENYP